MRIVAFLLTGWWVDAVRVPSRRNRKVAQDGTHELAQDVAQNTTVSDACTMCLEYGGGSGCLSDCTGKSSDCQSCVEFGGGSGCIDRCQAIDEITPVADPCINCLQYGGGSGCSSQCTAKSSDCQSCVEFGGGAGCIDRCQGGACANLYGGVQGSRETFLINRMSYSGTEAAQFMAQCAHECDNFNTMEEYASGAAYEGRTDLGNIYPGDGVRYKGRGFIQITGRYNYREFGGYIGVDLENNPLLAEDEDTAAQVAVEYWNRRVKPYVSDFSDTTAVTKKINGGTNGLQDRINKFNSYLNLCS